MCRKCNAEITEEGCFCNKVQPQTFPQPVRIERPVEGLDCHPRAHYLTAAFPIPF